MATVNIHEGQMLTLTNSRVSGQIQDGGELLKCSSKVVVYSVGGENIKKAMQKCLKTIDTTFKIDKISKNIF